MLHKGLPTIQEKAYKEEMGQQMEMENLQQTMTEMYHRYSRALEILENVVSEIYAKPHEDISEKDRHDVRMLAYAQSLLNLYSDYKDNDIIWEWNDPRIDDPEHSSNRIRNHIEFLTKKLNNQ